MMKLWLLDVETTGLNPKDNGIIQIASIFMNDGEVLGEYSWNIKPFKEDEIVDKALEVSGTSREDIKGFADPFNVYIDIKNILGKHVNKYDREDKFILVGYNAIFDYNFIREWFVKHGDVYFGSWAHFPPIDVMVLAAEHLKETRNTMENFKLVTVARELGISVDDTKLHDAMYDIQLTLEMYEMIAKPEVASK